MTVEQTYLALLRSALWGNLAALTNGISITCQDISRR